MNQVYSGPQSVTNHSTKARTDLRSITRPWINVTQQRRAETCQSQAGRPTTVPIHCMTPRRWSRARYQQRSSIQHDYNQSRSKGMNQVYSGPQSVTNHSTEARTNLRSITRPWINMTRQRRAEMSQSQADQPR